MMKTIHEILEFCQILSQCHPYPIHLYHHHKQICQIPDTAIDLLSPHYSKIAQMSTDSFLYQTPEDLLYGGVYSQNRTVLLLFGPVPLTTVSHEFLRRIMNIYDIPITQKDALLSCLGRGSGYSLPHFRNVLLLAGVFLNGDLQSAAQELNLSSDSVNQEMAVSQLKASIDTQDFSSYRAAYEFEKKLLDYVKKGDARSLKERVYTSPNMHIGSLSSSSLRQTKNLFICSTTLATRAAMEGGLDLDTAYSLSDFYLQRVEQLTTTADINELFDTMVIDFAKRTGEAKVAQDIPVDLYACLQYIRQNTHSPIKVSDVAEYANLSKSQLDRRFKKVLGFYPSEFIMRCRLEEAKELLIYTDKTANEISQILCFSSQSYFCNVFREKYHMTPGEFRRKQTAFTG